MKPSEIIQKDAERLGYDGDVITRKVINVVKSGAGILLQENDSLLLLIGLPNNSAELHLFTADSPLVLAKSLKKFVEKIKRTDMNAVYGSGDIPQILKMLNKLGVETTESNSPNYRWMAKV